MSLPERLESYFSGLRRGQYLTGAEIETQFVTAAEGTPVSLCTSQAMLGTMVARGWEPKTRKRVADGTSMLTEIGSCGDTITYELGRHNIEISLAPASVHEWRGLERRVRGILGELYRAGELLGAAPVFEPIVEVPENEDLLAIPDERDAAWLRLDGRKPLNLLARTSAVQYTIGVDAGQAIPLINRLLERLPKLLADYPQEQLWRRYIRESRAGYQASRYGGPLHFDDLQDYCRQLGQHALITEGRLIKPQEIGDDQWIGKQELFLRSVWWYFRLRLDGGLHSYLEMRPFPRREDEAIGERWEEILDIVEPSGF